MEIFEEYLGKIDNLEHREKTKKVLTWVSETFPNLSPRTAWNQPMFTNNGTFIIGFSIAKKHLAVAPEEETIHRFSKDIIEAGFNHTKQLMRIPWDKEVNYLLLEKIIEFNISDKAGYSAFWRK
ncbi:hypothetical protein SAMN05660462_02725 [Proteiniborus ethanoligenes]|uniref:YdhG-like domain-containing protein n=1 Tax=Proteiniborus ethanoligenes TaxID=415015 RepID=A0A1H3S5U8_9FIRM|nr:iron chaperone [Proteiniborus ethanoligenes]SDZ33274.1 hypothetical protein SAMN05660462_02725 [Proteiniborus ethanoligenes]